MTELQNDRQDKNDMPPDLRSWGHKNCIYRLPPYIYGVKFAYQQAHYRINK